MTLALPQVDRSLLLAVGLSLAAHGAFVAALSLTSAAVPPPPAIVSSIEVRLSAGSATPPRREPRQAQPPVAAPIRTQAVAVVPQLATLPPDTAGNELTPSPATQSEPAAPTPASTPKRTVAINTDAVRAFVDSRAIAPPTAREDPSVAEAYRRQWHDRMQRLGQLNYPATASRLGLSGQLTLHVAIRGDGSLAAVSVTQSSGYEALDEAALDMVRQSSPFAPLPPTLARTNGEFRFASTWQFQR